MLNKLRTLAFDVPEEEIAEVFSGVGATLFVAQCLEHAIATTVMLHDFVPKGLLGFTSKEKWDAEFEAYEANVWTNTFGRLIGLLKRVYSVEGDLASKLEHSLERRNWLAHRFMKERFRHLTKPETRAALLDELRADRELYESVTAELQHHQLAILQDYGVNLDFLMQEYLGVAGEFK